jgi:predicted MFS family arabinose efflux permease
VGIILALMAIGNALNFLPNSVYWTIIMDTEPSQTGTLSALTHFIINLATIIAPTFTGVLVSSYGYGSMFVAAAIIAAFGMTCMLFVKPVKPNDNLQNQNTTINVLDRFSDI